MELKSILKKIALVAFGFPAALGSIFAILYFALVISQDLADPYSLDASAVQKVIDRYRLDHGQYPERLNQICGVDQASPECAHYLSGYFYTRTNPGYQLVRIGTNWYEGDDHNAIKFRTKERP